MLPAFAALGVFGLAAAAPSCRSTSQDATVRWLGETPSYHAGTTFGVPWPKGKFDANKAEFSVSTGEALQSWVLAYWSDGSVKWSAHALPPQDAIADSYTITASGPPVVNGSASAVTGRGEARQTRATSLIEDTGDEFVINTGKIEAAFPKSGSVLVSSIKKSNGDVIGKNGKLILRSQDAIVDSEDDEPVDAAVRRFEFNGKINSTTVSQQSSERALVTIKGIHDPVKDSGRDAWLPFTVRFYLYKNSEAIRIVHSIVYNGNSTSDFISGLGLKFEVPLTDEELYNRHVRIAGPDGGLLNEAVQGITGLRRDPGAEARLAQYEGRTTPDKATWDQRVTSRLQYIPTWGDYRLTQLSADGFNLQKRTKQGQSWVTISGATRAGGLAYLGGSTVGGLAVGLRDFWKRYPTSLDISNAASDTGSITIWLYSPSAPPLDLRPYHDGLGQDTYAKQLEGLEITYEDYEPGYDTPYGIARTSEIYVYGFDKTPSQETLAALTKNTNKPPVLFAESEHIIASKALGTHWQVPGNTTQSAAATEIEGHLDFLDKFYQGEVATRRFYGFWDFGDFHHTYDNDRHTWRYDVGGYAWDNSELSPDLYLWNQFLRTGDLSVYRFAEAQARHGGDVDSYHIGPMKGLGTRHGVQHWGDSAKQARISTPIYRRVFYYVTGGDERTGEIVHEMLDVEKAFVTVDARRKVRSPDIPYTPDPKALLIAIGIEWAGMASGWLIEWERRGPRAEEAKSKILRSMADIAKLKNGFVTNQALYNSENGAMAPPPNDPDNKGIVDISHLSGQFGMLETIVQLVDHLGDQTPKGFEEAFIEYAYYYNADAAEQRARYGAAFGRLNLKQGHSRYTGYAAYKTKNATTAARAWREFYNSDGFTAATEWKTTFVGGSKVLVPVNETDFVSTNAYALYGLAATENLAYIGEFLEDSSQ
ncbi:hypothetical protein HJFPF1_08561 [Paramyrothecium foliicola]|nr:hypothetical protein HJFPF1_08561 [Paramyrothecium foliicola]